MMMMMMMMLTAWAPLGYCFVACRTASPMCLSANSTAPRTGCTTSRRTPRTRRFVKASKDSLRRRGLWDSVRESLHLECFEVLMSSIVVKTDLDVDGLESKMKMLLPRGLPRQLPGGSLQPRSAADRVQSARSGWLRKCCQPTRRHSSPTRDATGLSSRQPRRPADAGQPPTGTQRDLRCTVLASRCVAHPRGFWRHD